MVLVIDVNIKYSLRLKRFIFENGAKTFKADINNVLKKFGDDLVKFTRREMTLKKSGVLYGSHRASAVGESLANLTGKTSRSFKAKNLRRSCSLEFSGNGEGLVKYDNYGTFGRPTMRKVVAKKTPVLVRRLGRVRVI